MADRAISEETIKELAGELQKEYFELAKHLLLWASPDVIRAYDDFRNYAVTMNESDRDDDAKAMTMLCYTDRVFARMREDLELDDLSLQRGELISIFLTDPPEVKRRIKEHCP